MGAKEPKKRGRKPTVHYDDEGNPVEKESKPKRIHMPKTLRRMTWGGRRNQKENRKSRKLPRSPKRQKSQKRRVLKGKRKKKRQKSRKSGAGSRQCITTMRETQLRRSQSRKGSIC